MPVVTLSDEVALTLVIDTSHVQRPTDASLDDIAAECQWLSDGIVTCCIQTPERARRMKAALSAAASEIRILRRQLARIAREAAR